MWDSFWFDFVAVVLIGMFVTCVIGLGVTIKNMVQRRSDIWGG
jgi:hypothetical protein